MNFRVESCKTRHAYTKGTNEARNKVMDWLRSYSGEFDSIEELQKIVDKLNVKMNTNICQGTGMSPCLLFIKEKEYLTPLPDRTVLDGYLSPHKVKVSSQQLVYFNGAQYSVDRKYIDEYVSIETFDDMLQIYYKGKMIQVHTISRNPINYTKKHYEQSISKQFAGNKDFSKIVANNLSITDKLLDAREIVLTRNDALKSYDHMIAYLVSQVDELGYEKMDADTANLFFNLIAKRYEKSSTIITTNLTFSKWSEVFGDPVLTNVLLDRLLHHSSVLNINGPSYRLKDQLQFIVDED